MTIVSTAFSLSRINPQKYGGGLKLELDAEIEQKAGFYKNLI